MSEAEAMIEHEIESDIPMPLNPGGGPKRTPEQVCLVVKAAQSENVLKVAAAGIHASYFGSKAKCDGEEYYKQLAYLSKLISLSRRGSFPSCRLT